MMAKVFKSEPGVYNPDWRGGGGDALRQIDQDTATVRAVADTLKSALDQRITDGLNPVGARAADTFQRINTVLDNGTYRILEAHSGTIDTIEQILDTKFHALARAVDLVQRSVGPDPCEGGKCDVKPIQTGDGGVRPVPSSGEGVPPGSPDSTPVLPATPPEPVPLCPPGYVYSPATENCMPSAANPTANPLPPTWYTPQPPIAPPSFAYTPPNPPPLAPSPPIQVSPPMTLPGAPASCPPQPQPIVVQVTCSGSKSAEPEVKKLLPDAAEPCDKPAPTLDQTPDQFLAWLFREGSCGGLDKMRDWLPDSFDEIAATKDAAELKAKADWGAKELG